MGMGIANHLDHPMFPNPNKCKMEQSVYNIGDSCSSQLYGNGTQLYVVNCGGEGVNKRGRKGVLA